VVTAGPGSRLTAVVPSVWVATSRRYATTSTVVVGRDGSALVVDPAWDADELAGLASDVATIGASCAVGLATHVHYDHVLWHPGLGRPPRHASRWTAWSAQAHRDQVLAPLVGDLPEELLDLAARLVPVTGGREPSAVPDPAAGRTGALPLAYELPWGGHEVLLHEHDAHAPAHLAAEVVDLRVLVAGDMLSDSELPMPDDANPDLEAYLQGLDRLAEVAARCDLLVPGHGTPTSDPLSRVDADRRYLDDLLTRGESDDPRRWLPEMPDLHAANVRRATAQGQPSGAHRAR
jgi:glyoxylase-like metal-dependent hydrolase (beta-lactamase superfamily II)